MVFNKTYFTKIGKRQLFDAWVSPNMRIDPVYKIEVNLIVGGYLKLYSKFNNDIVLMEGKFLKIEKNRFLKYTWNWSNSSDVTIVSIKFTKKDGLTMVEVTHEGFERRKDVINHEEGWDHYFLELTKKICKN